MRALGHASVVSQKILLSHKNVMYQISLLKKSLIYCPFHSRAPGMLAVALKRP